MKESGIVKVDRTDIGASDHFLVWCELPRTTKCVKKEKRVIRRWRLERFVDDEVKVKYREALRGSVSYFSDRVQNSLDKGLVGSELVNDVLSKWEGIVNKVAMSIVGEKLIVCGRAARWWDDEVKNLIERRREVYSRIANGERGVVGGIL